MTKNNSDCFFETRCILLLVAGCSAVRVPTKFAESGSRRLWGPSKAENPAQPGDPVRITRTLWGRSAAVQTGHWRPREVVRTNPPRRRHHAQHPRTRLPVHTLFNCLFNMFIYYIVYHASYVILCKSEESQMRESHVLLTAGNLYIKLHCVQKKTPTHVSVDFHKIIRECLGGN